MSETRGKENITSQSEMTPHDVEKLEETKLKAKYPGEIVNGPKCSEFLLKRLAKGQKYFDSGDYQMAKQKMDNMSKQSKKVPGSMNAFVTGNAIPTPDSVSARKTSIIPSSKLTK